MQEQVKTYQLFVDEQISHLQSKMEQEQRVLTEKQMSVQSVLDELQHKQEIALADYDRLLEEQKKSKFTQMETSLAAEVALVRTEATAALSTFLSDVDQQKIAANSELAELQSLLEEYRQKTKSIHEAILRQRALDEQKDFYRVCLSDQALRDISILNEVRPRLSSQGGLDKLIYDVYISKPTQELLKRVLKGEKHGGIYKITRISTGEIYIGKASTFSDRWTQHIKSAFNVGTIADSLLHQKMREDGITNYTFEVLEVLPTDKQSEREKYWIEFYNSKAYGLNQRLG